jgi:hypothetical protein
MVTTAVHQKNQSLTAYVERHIMLEIGMVSILVEIQVVTESGNDEIRESGTRTGIGTGTGDMNGGVVDPGIKAVIIDDFNSEVELASTRECDENSGTELSQQT